ncbi:MAG: STAS domain-containing protein [Sulfuricella sp.]|nr:STAS domain-containing protein [Sulfuricella sp.]
MVVFSFFRKSPENEAKPASRSPAAAKVQPAVRASAPVKPAPVAAPISSAPSRPAQSARAAALPANPPPKTREHDPFTVGDAGTAVASAEMTSVAEEAAILYASGHAGQAAALLLDYTRSGPARADAQPWLMLFEIFQLQGEKRSFDELALEFVVKFERTAPVWDHAKVPGAKSPQAPAGPAGEGYVSLTGVLKGDKDSFFQSMVQTAQKGAGLRLDFSRLDGVEACGSRRLAETLLDLKKSGKKITPIGVAHLADLLKGVIGQGGEGEQAHWQLLLHLYQCQGMQAEFEDLAVDYAVTFEVSPPSWEPVCQGKTAAAAAPADAAPHDDDAFYLSGVISAASEQQFRKMADFAATHNEVLLDMAGVPRVDFVSVGNFVGALAGLSGSGKKVLIRNANELIRALFAIMGADQFATILRGKAG